MTSDDAAIIASSKEAEASLFQISSTANISIVGGNHFVFSDSPSAQVATIVSTGSYFSDHWTDIKTQKRSLRRLIELAWAQYDADKDGKLKPLEVVKLCRDFYAAIPEVIEFRSQLGARQWEDQLTDAAKATTDDLFAEMDGGSIDWTGFETGFPLMKMLKEVQNKVRDNPQGTTEHIEDEGEPESLFQLLQTKCLVKVLMSSSNSASFMKLILEKPPNLRLSSEVDYLFKTCSESFTKFNMCPAQTRKVLRNLAYMGKKKNTYLFQEGDPGDFFYVILHGCTSVRKDDARGTPVDVALMHEGVAFGELALMTSFGTRKASIYCKTDTVFGVLQRSSFLKIMLPYVKRMYIEKINFLRKCPSLQTASSSEIEELAYTARIKRYEPASVIRQQGDPIGANISLIQAGQIRVVRELRFPPVNLTTSIPIPPRRDVHSDEPEEKSNSPSHISREQEKTRANRVAKLKIVTDRMSLSTRRTKILQNIEQSIAFPPNPAVIKELHQRIPRALRKCQSIFVDCCELGPSACIGNAQPGILAESMIAVTHCTLLEYSFWDCKRFMRSRTIEQISQYMNFVQDENDLFELLLREINWNEYKQQLTRNPNRELCYDAVINEKNRAPKNYKDC